VGKLLAYFGRDWAEAFPEAEDGADQLVPVSDFGSWLRNFRVRKGLKQVELAQILGVSTVTICRYERRRSKPQSAILQRLKKSFGLDVDLDGLR